MPHFTSIGIRFGPSKQWKLEIFQYLPLYTYNERATGMPVLHYFRDDAFDV